MPLNPEQLKSGGLHWELTFPTVDESEKLECYTGDGLCPVIPGDVLSGEELFSKSQRCSFTVIGKLGRGGFATVWLVQDNTSPNDKSKCLALKVLRHDVSHSDNKEMRILRKLGRLQAAFFYTHKPTNRQFLCLGMRPVGCTLSKRCDACFDPPSDATSICTFIRTLVTRVREIHDKGIHHGDLSPSNVCLGLHMDALKESCLQSSFENDRINPIVTKEKMKYPPPRPAYLPEYLVVGGEGLLSDGEDLSLIEIIDFGSASDAKFSKSGELTRFYSADEVAQDPKGIKNPRTDLWSLGCVIAFGLTDYDLFQHSQEYGDYAGASSDTQLAIIDKHIKLGNDLLYAHDGLRMAVARVIHSLVQLNPEMRDLKRTEQLVRQMDRYAS